MVTVGYSLPRRVRRHHSTHIAVTDDHGSKASHKAPLPTPICVRARDRCDHRNGTSRFKQISTPLGRDPERKTSQNGRPYLRLNVRIGAGGGAQWVAVSSTSSPIGSGRTRGSISKVNS